MGYVSLVPPLAYLAGVVFVLGIGLRILKYARAPMHVRWELYPVPHKKGSEYGGSYFEEPDWWTRPREKSLGGEIRAMLEEMLLIRSLWHHNRPQWYASFPFHLGLYILIGFTGLLAIEAAAQPALAPSPATWAAVEAVTVGLGVAGLALASLGALLLLYRRASDPALRSASTRVDYVNLLFVLAVLGAAIFAWASADTTFSGLRTYLGSLLSLRPAASVGPAVAAEVALVALFMIYLPFTHMTHFVAKYFTYHQVRWDDEPNLGEASMQRRMMDNLRRPVGWGAPHIQPDRSWAEVATEVK